MTTYTLTGGNRLGFGTYGSELVHEVYKLIEHQPQVIEQ